MCICIPVVLLVVLRVPGTVPASESNTTSQGQGRTTPEHDEDEMVAPKASELLR